MCRWEDLSGFGDGSQEVTALVQAGSDHPSGNRDNWGSRQTRFQPDLKLPDVGEASTVMLILTGAATWLKSCLSMSRMPTSKI